MTTRAAWRRLIGMQYSSLLMVYGVATSAGQTTTLTDNVRLLRLGGDRHWLVGKALVITGGASAGSVRRISDYDPDTGIITFTPLMTAVASSDAYEIWSEDVARIDDGEARGKFRIHQAIDEGLGRLYYDWLHEFTLAADGDFEAAGTSDWAGTNATVTKNTSVVAFGVQSLQTVTTAANGYAASNNIAVSETESYTVEVCANALAGEADLIVWDQTNGAEIFSTTFTELIGHNVRNRWGRLYLSFPIPAGCLAVAIRLANTGNSSTTRWDNCIVRENSRTMWDLPTWVTEPGDISDLVVRPIGRRFGQELWHPLPASWDVIASPPSVTDFRVYHPATTDVVALRGVRPYAALTTTSDTWANNDAADSTAPEAWAIPSMMALLYDKLILAGKNNDEYVQQRKRWADEFSTVSRRMMRQRPQPLRLTDLVRRS